MKVLGVYQLLETIYPATLSHISVEPNPQPVHPLNPNEDLLP
jgi:hypothetical protein